MDYDGTSLDNSTHSVVNGLTISMDDEVFNEYEPMDELFVKANGPQTFSFKDLADATSNFSEPLGEGGFGAVCKGFLKDLNCYVAVKRLSRDSRQGIKEFASEVTIISQLRHRNILPLKGWCYERKELLLVYEFMSEGSLDHHLFKETSWLRWDVRYKIALGLASGLRYLQEELEEYVVHRDIKASNVMLDSNFNPKLGDFGLARRVERGRGPNETPLAGTPGYVAPEYSVTHMASKESDIYSFGIVALEIACGRKIIDRKVMEDQINLREWVWDLYGKGKLLEAVDPRLNGNFDKKQVECLMIVGLWCAHPYEKSRPCIEKAVHVLSFIVPLPDLPSSMPMIKDFALLSMSSVCTDLVHSPNSFSEDEKLRKKRGVVALDKRLDNPLLDKDDYCFANSQLPSSKIPMEAAPWKQPDGSSKHRVTPPDGRYNPWFEKWERSKVKKEANYNYRMFSYEELVHATDNFSKKNKLEQKATGVVYRGFLKEVNSYVAVNVVSERHTSYWILKESDVMYLGHMRHENLVKTVGWCLHNPKKKLILVDEFMHNGNLDSHLFEKDSHLKWEKRYKIAKGVASGFLYLSNKFHDVGEDITSRDVWLDIDCNAKLGNFWNMFILQGYGSGACFSLEERLLSNFGIIALQIACGKEHVEIESVWKLYIEGKVTEAADPRLKGKYNKVQMKTLMLVGLWFWNRCRTSRSIREVIQVLDSKAPLPYLHFHLKVDELDYCNYV